MFYLMEKIQILLYQVHLVYNLNLFLLKIHIYLNHHSKKLIFLHLIYLFYIDYYETQFYHLIFYFAIYESLFINVVGFAVAPYLIHYIIF